jgi:hypothetical protein
MFKSKFLEVRNYEIQNEKASNSKNQIPNNFQKEKIPNTKSSFLGIWNLVFRVYFLKSKESELTQ